MSAATIVEDMEELFDSFAMFRGGIDVLGSSVVDLTVVLNRLPSSLRTIDSAIAPVAGTASSSSSALDSLANSAKGLNRDIAPTSATSDAASKALDSLKGSADKMVGSLAPTSGALGTVSKALKTLGPEGMAAAAGIGVAATAVAGFSATLWQWSSAAVTAAQKRDALLATFGALTGGAEAGAKTLAMTGKVAASLPFATSQVNSWAKSLLAAGIHGDALERSLRATAAATAIMGDEGGSAAQELLTRLSMTAEIGGKIKLDRRLLNEIKHTSVSVEELAAALGMPAKQLSATALSADKLGSAFQSALVAKGGPALEALGLQWDTIKAKFDKGLGSVFGGLSEDVKPFMVQVKSLFEEFDSGGTLMRGAQGVMHGLLSTVLQLATKGVHAIHVAFLELQIGALKAYIYLAPIISTLKKIAMNSVFLTGVKTVLGGIAIVLAAVVGSIALTGAYFALMGAIVGGAVIGIGAAVNYLYYLVIGTIVDMAGKAWTVLVGWATDAKGAATNFVMGLVEGITGGVGAVIDAVGGLASKAADAFTGFFEIKSPSRLMQRHGMQLPAGAAEGVDRGAVQLEQAMDGMWEVPKPEFDAAAAPTPKPRVGPAAQGMPGASSPRPIEFTNCTFFGTTKEQIRELMLLVLAQEAAAGPEPT